MELATFKSYLTSIPGQSKEQRAALWRITCVESVTKEQADSELTEPASYKAAPPGSPFSILRGRRA